MRALVLAGRDEELGFALGGLRTKSCATAAEVEEALADAERGEPELVFSAPGAEALARKAVHEAVRHGTAILIPEAPP